MDGVRIETDLTYGHFEQMEALEARSYGSEFIAPASEAWAWYQCHPASVTAAVDATSGAVVGFANLFAVEKPVFDALLAGTFNDATLTADQILPLPRAGEPPLRTMFLSCIAVDEHWRGRGMACFLLREAARFYAGAVAPDARIVTDNVTPAGARLSERLGFGFAGFSDHGSRIYERDFAGFVAALGCGPRNL